MIDEAYLTEHFTLNPPASPQQIAQAQSVAAFTFPKDYRDFLLIGNGLTAPGGLALHEIDALPARNQDYDVPGCLPGYFMIGDDSGGQAILIDAEGRVFEVGMGVMDARFLAQSADSLEDLLRNKQGLTLGER